LGVFIRHSLIDKGGCFGSLVTSVKTDSAGVKGGRSVAPQRAQGLWKAFGHAGSVEFSRATDFEIGKLNDKHLLRRFGQVTDEYR